MEKKPIETICIVGVGFMGTQIGLHCAAHGYEVWFIDISREIIERATESYTRELHRRVKNKKITISERNIILSRIHLTTNMKEGTAGADLVIETATERLETKREIFNQLDQVCPDHTILATNSSSIRISRIEDVTHRPDKVLNAHFYSSIWQNTVVELMRGTATSDETIERVRRFAHNIGLVPLLVRKESTGFIYNRVWRAIKKECLRVVAEGVASHEDIDRTWMILLDRPIGPFGMMDRVGLDVVRDIEMVYHHESGDESDAPPRFLSDKIERGELGIKTGKGFYIYPNPAFQNPSWLRGNTETCV